MAFDRFVALTWPLKTAAICTMTNAKRSVAFIVTVGLVYGGVQVVRTNQMRNKTGFCPFRFEAPNDVIFDTIYAVNYTLIPVLSMLIFNVGIIVAIRRSSKEVNQSTNKRATSIERSIALTTVVMVTVFIVFNVPNKVENILRAVWNVRVTPTVILWRKVSLNGGMLLENLNYCLNSYFYVLASKRFRSEMAQIIRTCSLRKG
jgi:hypothetical protein